MTCVLCGYVGCHTVDECDRRRLSYTGAGGQSYDPRQAQGCAGGAGGTSYQVDPRIATEKERQRPFMLLQPVLHHKGGKWLATYGDLDAWGDTPEAAALAFDKAWRGES